MVAMGAGLPEHYLSEGGDVNRATAAEMGLPVMKKYQRRQDVLRYILTAILDRVIAEAQKAGTLPSTIDTTYTITFPDLKAEATKDIGTAAWHMSSALQTAMQLGLCSRETASEIFFKSSRQEVDHNEEWDRIEQDRAELGPAHPMNVVAARAAPTAPSPGNDDNPSGQNGSVARERGTDDRTNGPIPLSRREV
jgi:hypothetical protein